MPEFSVISPVYNTSEYLHGFIGSILGQTFPDFELILVDDGSSDDSLAICREYAAKDDRVTVLTQKNQGAGSARNLGIETAKGTYLLFYDSDDLADIRALEKLSAVITAKRADLYLYGADEIRLNKQNEMVKSGERIPPRLDLITKEDCRKVFCDLIFSAVLNPPWNKVYRRDLVMEYGVRFADTRRAQDAFFNMDYFCRIESLYAVPDVCYCYRTNSQDKVWKKYPKDIYKIDVRYNTAVEECCREFGVYSGHDRERVDKWFFMSVLRDAGFYRNPHWKLSRREKRVYVDTVISDPYIVERAKRSQTPDKITKSVKKRILEHDAKGLMRDIRRHEAFCSLYDLYCRSLRKLIKRKSP